MTHGSDWKTVKLTDIAEQIIERVDNPQDSKLIDYIGLEHIESDNLKIPQYGKTSDVTSSKFECKKGDIIFGRRRAYLRKLAISDKDALVSTDAIVVRPKTGVLKEFLIIIMQSDKFWEEAISRSAGSLSPRVKWKDIGNFKVTLPPVKKQEEISNLIFSIQENIERSERLIRVCELFRIEFMIDTLQISSNYSGLLSPKLDSIPKGWTVMRIADLVENTQNGFPSGKRDEKGIVQIRMNNVTTDGKLCFEHFLKVPKPRNISKYSIEEGDILFNNTNSVDLVGKSAIFYDAIFDCTFSNHFTRIRVKKEEILPEVLHSHLLVWQKEGFFKNVAQRHVGQSEVSLRDVLSAKIAVPPMSTQKNFITTLLNLERLVSNISLNVESLSALKRSLVNSMLTGRMSINGDN